MLILILLDAQYLQKVIFSFEKGLNSQNHSSSGSQHPIKKFTPVKFSNPPNGGGVVVFTHSLTIFEKPCYQIIWCFFARFTLQDSWNIFSGKICFAGLQKMCARSGWAQNIGHIVTLCCITLFSRYFVAVFFLFLLCNWNIRWRDMQEKDPLIWYLPQSFICLKTKKKTKGLLFTR